ncbi:hypothetical protein HYPSUDRAFT_218999 [Hypholoma sublateritium FD-334 SS-4]|uniref:Uncharacterized protein n=1 Tax=Hypholoma sublateritium (strain FD-334 SS-4) TaxID=945553 RepID=A0A0D2KRM6_HYPSF|nr:hypothetical protein HYPSUDRAFT_218999 [Hypholoma sublateritium FD-334 SS-4]
MAISDIFNSTPYPRSVHHAPRTPPRCRRLCAWYLSPHTPPHRRPLVRRRAECMLITIPNMHLPASFSSSRASISLSSLRACCRGASPLLISTNKRARALSHSLPPPGRGKISLPRGVPLRAVHWHERTRTPYLGRSCIHVYMLVPRHSLHSIVRFTRAGEVPRPHKRDCAPHPGAHSALRSVVSDMYV